MILGTKHLTAPILIDLAIRIFPNRREHQANSFGQLHHPFFGVCGSNGGARKAPRHEDVEYIVSLSAAFSLRIRSAVHFPSSTTIDILISIFPNPHSYS